MIEGILMLLESLFQRKQTIGTERKQGFFFSRIRETMRKSFPLLMSQFFLVSSEYSPFDVLGDMSIASLSSFNYDVKKWLDKEKLFAYNNYKY